MIFSMGRIQYFDLIYNKRPEFELYNVIEDPYCLNNLSGNPTFEATEIELKGVLIKELTESEDPRMVGPDKEIFDSYKRYNEDIQQNILWLADALIDDIYWHFTYPNDHLKEANNGK